MSTYYSVHMKPFCLFPQKPYSPEIVAKSHKYTINHFAKINNTTIRFDALNQSTKVWYNRFINISPAYCPCYTYLDRAYCHHILAINRLEVANIVIDPTFIPATMKRTLVAKRSKRGRPKQVKGALVKN